MNLLKMKIFGPSQNQRSHRELDKHLDVNSQALARNSYFIHHSSRPVGMAFSFSNCRERFSAPVVRNCIS